MPVVSDLYYTFGGGDIESPPIVLLHGAGGTHLNWPSAIRRLPGYRVYALDLPGHGKSGGRGQQSISLYAIHVMDWLEAIGLQQAVFVGHSMGGAIALALGIHNPEHVAGLGLVGTGARLRVHPEILEYAANPTMLHKAVEMIIAWSFSSHAGARLVESIAQRMLAIRPSVLLGDLQACNEFDVIDKVSRIHRPTLVICGGYDQMTPLRYSQYLANAIPLAQLVVVPNAGHMVMLEHSQDVAKALASFLISIAYHPGETL